MTQPRPPSPSSRARTGAAAPSLSHPRPTRNDFADVIDSLPAPPPRAAQARTGPIREPAPSPDSVDLGEIHPLHPSYRAPDTDDLCRPPLPWADSRETLSRASSDTGSLRSVRSDEDDTAHLTADAPTGIGAGTGAGASHARSSTRPYDSEGKARAGPLGIITRSPTIRRVSTTLRNASIRVQNIMGTEKEGYEGLTRLPTNDERAESPLEMSSAPSTPPDPPPPLPPPPPVPGRLRGRTLGVFSASNPLRRAMNRVVLFP
jgi:hypothetical protein